MTKTRSFGSDFNYFYDYNVDKEITFEKWIINVISVAYVTLFLVLYWNVTSVVFSRRGLQYRTGPSVICELWRLVSTDKPKIGYSGT